MQIEEPYLLFLGDVQDRPHAKTAAGIAYWRPDAAKAQLRLPSCPVDLGLPEMTVAAAAAAGVRTIIVGVAPDGGELPRSWVEPLAEGLTLGLDIASGLHTRLAAIPALKEAAAKHGRKIHDVRFPVRASPIATGAKRAGKRLLTVGTDCAVGKMYTALALEREMRTRGMNADFRATGQTGILICGSGVAVDAVVSDFVAGAAETLSPDAPHDHWDVVEGQGSLFHPSYAGVSLGLLHGSQPDFIVMCHDAARPSIIGVHGYDLPGIAACIETNLRMGRLTNPAIRCAGVSVNTSALSEGAARAFLLRTAAETGLPCVDPVRTGVAPLIDVLASP